jgi:hypothetical protein
MLSTSQTPDFWEKPFITTGTGKGQNDKRQPRQNRSSKEKIANQRNKFSLNRIIFSEQLLGCAFFIGITTQKSSFKM